MPPVPSSKLPRLRTSLVATNQMEPLVPLVSPSLPCTPPLDHPSWQLVSVYCEYDEVEKGGECNPSSPLNLVVLTLAYFFTTLSPFLFLSLPSSIFCSSLSCPFSDPEYLHASCSTMLPSHPSRHAPSLQMFRILKCILEHNLISLPQSISHPSFQPLKHLAHHSIHPLPISSFLVWTISDPQTRNNILMIYFN